jgi:uncharacterized protein (DUF302 family)
MLYHLSRRFQRDGKRAREPHLSSALPSVLATLMLSEAAMSAATAVDGLRILPTRRTVADILGRAESLARARGLTVFSRIDFSGDAATSGLTLRPAGLLILGNPKAGTPLIAAAATVAIDLPLKLLAWEDADGHTWVAYNEPAYLQARHRFPPDLVKNIAALGALAAAAAADEP